MVHITQTKLSSAHFVTWLKQSWQSNPWLTLIGIASVMILLGSLVGLLTDHQIITGIPAWNKPLKFAISIAIYAFTLVWILTFVRGRRWVVRIFSVITTITLLLEMVIIIGQVIRGTTSHFNISTPLDTTLYGIMGGLIINLWIVTFLAVFLLQFQTHLQRAFVWSLRLGLFIALVGMSVAWLMIAQLSPAQQATIAVGHRPLSNGAHSVGVNDGGPGLPFLGWSTVGGDLRIPHFFGLHGLQAIPLLSWLLLLVARRLGVAIRGQVALVWTTGLSYLGLILLLTWQALRGQSIVRPDALTLTAFSVLATTTIIVISTIFFRFRTHYSIDGNEVQTAIGD